VPGGTTGQAGRIASATGGQHLLAPSAEDVANRIRSGLQSFKTDVWATIAADPGLSVSISPQVRYAVTMGTTVDFSETITITATEVGRYYATVHVLGE